LKQDLKAQKEFGLGELVLSPRELNKQSWDKKLERHDDMGLPILRNIRDVRNSSVIESSSKMNIPNNYG
jgi:hypothetical protein